MNRSGWAFVCTAAFGLASFAHAQSTERTEPDKQPTAGSRAQPEPAPPRRARAMRKPIIDLRALARERRPGQVLPGDPSPLTSTIPELAPLPEPAATPKGVQVQPGPPDGPIDLPDTVPVRKPLISPSQESRPAAAPSEPASVAPSTEPEVAEPIASAPAAGQTDAPTPAAQPETTASDAAPAVRVVTVPTPAPTAPTAPVTPVATPEPDPASAPMPTPAPAATPDTPTPAATLSTIVEPTDAPLSLGPALVRVERASTAQWRVAEVGSPWATPTPGEQLSSRIEVRAGIDADAEFIIDERIVVRLTRLGRAVIERAATTRGEVPHVTLARGGLEIRPLSTPGASDQPPAMIALVKTPDQSFGVTGGVRVDYDAFSGTRRRVVNP